MLPGFYWQCLHHKSSGDSTLYKSTYVLELGSELPKNTVQLFYDDDMVKQSFLVTVRVQTKLYRKSNKMISACIHGSVVTETLLVIRLTA